MKPPYQRCSVGTKENLKKLNFKKGVYSQTKEDGQFSSYLNNEFKSRIGILKSFPILEKSLLNIKDFALTGELTVLDESDRSKANGLINSANPPHERIIFTIWDAIPLKEYKLKDGTSKYSDRLKNLEKMVAGLKNVKVVKTRTIRSIKEAYAHFQEVTKSGGEGTVVKSLDMKWKDGNSKEQLKVKLEVETEVRITKFEEGNKGSKNQAYFSGISFKTDDGKVTGTVGVTTMSHKIRNELSKNRSALIGKIMTVQFNDLTGSNALNHPRFVEIRKDRKTTDTLQRIIESKNMAMSLS